MASMTNDIINVHVDPKDKELVTNILKDLGLNMTTLINMTLKQVIKKNGVPFEVVNPRPSEELLEALKEGAKMASNLDNYSKYNNREELKEALLKDE